MPKFYVHIHARPHEGTDEEFHQWYENTHVHEVLEIAGFKAAQRFVWKAGLRQEPANSHLAIYEAEADSAAEVIDRLDSTRLRRNISPTFDGSAAILAVYQAAGSRYEKD